jgi:hypothetical protein
MRKVFGAMLLSVCALPEAVLAQEAVSFDARSLFSCAEVKPPQQADSARKVVVIVIPVSANFMAEEASVEILHYDFRFPKSVTILDHYPKTQPVPTWRGLQRNRYGNTRSPT